MNSLFSVTCPLLLNFWLAQISGFVDPHVGVFLTGRHIGNFKLACILLFKQALDVVSIVWVLLLLEGLQVVLLLLEDYFWWWAPERWSGTISHWRERVTSSSIVDASSVEPW